MRISTRRDDPGHVIFECLVAQKKRVEVYLDDELVTNCVTADSNLGFVVQSVLDENDLPVLNEDRTDIKTIRKRGKVRIEVLDWRHDVLA
jgi:hypothetical protein